MTLYLIFCGIFGVAVGFAASNKGRSGVGYFLLSILISPLLAVLILFLTGDNEPEVEKQKLKNGAYKKCSFCAELVKKEAVVCKHCNRELKTETFNESISNPHAQLQDAIYKKDVNRVKAMLNEGIDLGACDLAFSHEEYAKAYGNNEIRKLLKID